MAAPTRLVVCLGIAACAVACGSGVSVGGSDVGGDASAPPAVAASTTPPDSSSASSEGDEDGSRGVIQIPTVPPEPADPDDGDDGSTAPVPAEPGGVPQVYLSGVLDDAASRTGVPVAAIEVLRAESVTWRDGSLGCPEPGISYTQALVPGYWIEVRAREVLLDYRLVSTGRFKLCEADASAGLQVPEPPQKGEPIPPPSAPDH